jgi:FKBP-type peptidyl-prolyl cis-trans isomerase FklB
MSLADKLFKMKSDKAASNLKEGQDFLAANSSKPGVVSLPSGLQYEVITEGTGEKPGAADTVTCHYHGTLINGTIFDSSVQRGRPASFPLNQVIKGWTEGVQLMSIGSKWRFFIPPHLGYGDRQVGPTIGPNSTLIFEVELLSIS